MKVISRIEGVRRCAGALAMAACATACAVDDPVQNSDLIDESTEASTMPVSGVIPFDNSCTNPYCGWVYNDSSIWVAIAGGGSPADANANGWCWGDNAPRYGFNPFNCTIDMETLQPGETSTKYHHDTDSFRADAGCITKFRDTAITAPSFDGSDVRVEDRRGKSQDKWIKLNDFDTIHITYQNCSSSSAKYYASSWAKGFGYQDQWCYQDSTSEYPWGYGARCKIDGELLVANNYYYCKAWGARVGGTLTFNHYWLLTDLDTVYAGRDGRSFVSAYNLTGGPNSTDNDSAYYYDASSRTWKWIPDC